MCTIPQFALIRVNTQSVSFSKLAMMVKLVNYQLQVGNQLSRGMLATDTSHKQFL